MSYSFSSKLNTNFLNRLITTKIYTVNWDWNLQPKFINPSRESKTILTRGQHYQKIFNGHWFSDFHTEFCSIMTE